MLSIRFCPPSPSNARQRRTQRMYLLIQALKGGRRGHDDYHATLNALNSRGHIIPRKSLGQHYMLNSIINEQLSSIAGVGDGDVVLEIGPGTGSLTNVLINAGATVIAVEKDPHMAMIVKERFGCINKLTVLQEDITRCHIRSQVSSLLEKANAGGVVKYAKHEAALRLAEFEIRSSEYRPVNLFVNFYSDAEYICKVERTNFFPQPNVDAAVAKFKLKKMSEYPQVNSTKDFFSMVNSAFNEKRKMLRKTLQHICPAPEIEEALRAVGLQATARPQDLTLEDFVRLYNMLSKTDKINQ